MFLEVDVQAGENCDYSLNRIFSTVSDPVEITAVETLGPLGKVDLFAVVGWSTNGLCSVHAVLVEDSGEGHALLIYGGDDGIRLRKSGGDSSWSLEHSDEWGEPCLLVDVSTQIEKVANDGH